MAKEVWKKIPGHDNYFASSLGNIKYGKKILSKYNIHGYNFVDILVGKKHKLFKVSRLTASAFLVNLDNKPHINHIDGDKLNDSISNIERCTASENMLHSYSVLGRSKNRPRLGKLGIDHNGCKRVYQYSSDGVLVRIRDCIADIKRALGVRESGISSACNGRIKTSGGYQRRFTPL